MAWEVLFYETRSGRTPIDDFLDGLSVKAREKCLSYVELLVEKGFSLPANYIKKVEGELWELRPEFGGTEYRLFYFLMVKDKFVIIHAFVKRTQRTPTREITTALNRIEEVKARLAAGEFNEIL